MIPRAKGYLGSDSSFISVEGLGFRPSNPFPRSRYPFLDNYFWADPQPATDYVDNGDIHIKYVNTHDNNADIHTKFLPNHDHLRHTKWLGPYEPDKKINEDWAGPGIHWLGLVEHPGY